METKQLPYCTDNGHEYEIHINPIDNTAHVHCKIEGNTAPDMELITENDALDIIEAAKTYGIKTVILHTDYGVAIHSYTLKTAKRFKGFYINKLISY